MCHVLPAMALPCGASRVVQGYVTDDHAISFLCSLGVAKIIAVATMIADEVDIMMAIDAAVGTMMHTVAAVAVGIDTDK